MVEDKKMSRMGSSTFWGKITVLIAVCGWGLSAQAKYAGGSGIAADPYQIATKADLLALGANTVDYGKCFILTADIDLDPNLPGGQIFTTAIIAADTLAGNSFEGTYFTGRFDGNGHKISHFTINGGSNYYLGLFGGIIDYGSVKNLGIENCSVSGFSYVGGLVGRESGILNFVSISNCYSTGTVSGSSGSYYLGGLVGYNGGNISNCYSTGDVSGGSSSGAIGGLVGKNWSGIISNCFSTGAVTGGDDSGSIGGLVGSNSSSIRNCYSTGVVNGSESVGGLAGHDSGGISSSYSTGSVNGTYYVGGLVGYTIGGISNCYSISGVSGYSGVGGLVGLHRGASSNCYSAGAVSGDSDYDVGGLMGYNDGSVSSSFWDTRTTCQLTSDGGTSKTTAQMQIMSTFADAGWDFIEVWDIGENQTYPFLRTYLAGDINHDGVVDFRDITHLAADWLGGVE
jgi:hypothetical protein